MYTITDVKNVVNLYLNFYIVTLLHSVIQFMNLVFSTFTGILIPTCIHM